MYGVDWDTLAKEIPTKEKTQIKNYYQNYKLRLELDQIELPQNAKRPKASRGRGQGGVDSSRASTPRPGQHLPTSISSRCIHIDLRFGHRLYYGENYVLCIMVKSVMYYGENY